MNIVFFEFVTNLGGARLSTIETARRLAEDDVNVTVIDAYGSCPAFADLVRASGVSYGVLKPQAARIVGGAGRGILQRACRLALAMPDLLVVRHRLRRALTEFRADIVLCNETKGMAVASSAARCPVVGFMRGWYRTDRMVPYVRYLLKHRLDHLIAVSNATRSALLGAGIPHTKITVIQNPVDVGELERKADLPLAAPLPRRRGTFNILLAANILQEKGQHTAIGALPELVRPGYNPVLYLAGGVPFGAPRSYQEKLRRLAIDLNVEKHVEWLGVRRDLPQVMRLCDCVVLPSHSEGMPRVVLEAMALAKPVVATLVGGVADILIPGLTGLSCEVDDAPSLAQSLSALATDPHEALKLARRARTLLLNRFQPRQHTQSLKQLCSRLASCSALRLMC